MAKKQAEIADSFPMNEIMESNPLFTRREMLGVAGMAGLTALAGMTPLAGSAAGAVSQTMQTRPRIACIVSFWGAPGSHADWIITKLLDGYWWKGAHTAALVPAAVSDSSKALVWIILFAALAGSGMASRSLLRGWT